MDDANRQHSSVPANQPKRPPGRSFARGRLSTIDSFIATNFIPYSFDVSDRTERRTPFVSVSMLVRAT